jgi:FkbM family methyltransferase
LSLKERLHVPDIEVSLHRLQRAGFAPRAVIDVGANVGDWTRMCRRVFPAVRILAVEPQAGCEPALRAMAAQMEGVTIVQQLVGARDVRGVPFHVHNTVNAVSSVLREPDGPPVSVVMLDMTTLDAVLEAKGFGPADFLKLDVQGYELEVLTGAPRALAAATVVLMEINLIPVYEGAPLLHEAVAFMHDAGFQAYDICSQIRRPLDDALFQTDMLFVRRSSPLVASTRWQ